MRRTSKLLMIAGLSLTIMFGCKKDSDKVTYTNTIVPLTILGFTNAPTAVLNQSFVRQLPAMGGKPPYTWTIAEGTIPPGLSLSPNGRIYGIPTSAGQYSYKLTLTDSKGSTSTSSYTQTISTSGTTPFLLGTPQIPEYGQNQDVGYSFFAQGGSLPWTFVITGLPAGLTYDPASGLISGSSPDPFSGSITITLQDAAQTMASGSPATASFAVNAPQPTGGGGNGGGNFAGCPSSYEGTYIGQFTYVYYQKGQDDTYSPVNAGFQLTIRLSCLASAGGSTVLLITHANCSEPAFNCQLGGCTPGTVSIATLPADPPTNSSNPSMSGQGILITFPNGSTIGTANAAGNLNVSSDGRTLSNSLSPDIQNSTWVAMADGFHSGSVPTGGPVTEFKSWIMTWSNTLKESYQTLLSTNSLMNCKDCCYP